MKRTARAGFATSVFLTTLLVASVAYAMPLIYDGKGVGGARLGRSASYNLSKLGKPSRSYVNRQYPNPSGTGFRTVYIYYWGKSMGGGRYPLCMYALKGSNNSKTTFNFTAYSSRYKMSRTGVAVGTSESTLRSKYSTAKRRRTATYTYYTTGSSGRYTVFTVRKGRVFSITVRR